MLIRTNVLAKIASGEVSLAFRRWVRPSVRPGGTLRTAIGILAIDAVEEVTEAGISDADARAAGATSRADLLGQLEARDGKLYRIRLRWLADDPRVALRDVAALTQQDILRLRQTLTGIDQRNASGPWTQSVLQLIAARDGITAAEIATAVGMEKLPLKQKIRRLKELGLTESLVAGYRLSPRGRALLAAKDR